MALAKPLLFASLLACALAARADLVVNGRFTGDDGGPSAQGWTVNDGVEPNAYLGPNCVRGGTQNGIDALLWQTLAVETGRAYRLTFDALSNQGVNSPNGLDVRLGSSLLYTNSSDLPWSWTTYSVAFVAGSERDLSFVLRDHSSTVSLTNVSVQAVPEPMPLAVLGLGGLVFRRGRRRPALKGR